MSRDLEKLKQWRKENRERLRAQERSRYWADPEKHRAKRRRLRKNVPPEIAKERRRAQNLKMYGLTLEQYDSLVVLQMNKCKICGGPPTGNGNKLHVDHDHRTGKVRGLLCHPCNLGLGSFKDNQDYLRNAILYLNGAG